MSDDPDIDARGLKCPLPVLKLRKRLKALKDLDEITLLTDDPAAVIDVPFFCSETGHELLEQISESGGTLFRVRKNSS